MPVDLDLQITFRVERTTLQEIKEFIGSPELNQSKAQVWELIGRYFEVGPAVDLLSAGGYFKGVNVIATLPGFENSYVLQRL
ncbi:MULTISPECIES: hypothetical protein [Pseudomonas]|uniref:Uncharacterized protein n=1 Tax=Pseudomonas putida (strain DOT-T1E) TaxID=1196325 RepID=I7B9W3_PSEPT|nr:MULTISPECIES: hypothetical protein [Pseudomonas]AFO48193.1 hypothetical protein T1E_2345 [Pseudomonas putida DOT-T1E]UZM94695.1 hypothetical protein OPZ46_04535 [Pseudomonas putida DOT-T1E]WPO31522.1 hypothetical protein REH59_07710 [Pseudomonas sp. BO3-4]